MRNRLWQFLPLLALALTAACATGPSYPEPAPGNGQILVELNGEARDGVGGPATSRDRTQYGSTSRSVEQGKAFERVNYNAIEDVVVIVSDEVPILRDIPLEPIEARLTIRSDGFDRMQVVSGNSGNGRRASATLTIRNTRAEDLTIYGFTKDGSDFELSVPARGEASISVFNTGVYELTCDEDIELHGVWFANTRDLVWFGNSRDAAFFDFMPPGEYTVEVFAPRLPAWSRKVRVVAGQRATVSAELTVNTLPKAGK